MQRAISGYIAKSIRCNSLATKRLRTIEIRLGRIGYALEWHQLHHVLSAQLLNTDEQKSKLLNDDIFFGSLMGLLLIKTPDEQLKMLEKLPDMLLQMDMDFAALGLMYRLGGKELVPDSFKEKCLLMKLMNFQLLSLPACPRRSARRARVLCRRNSRTKVKHPGMRIHSQSIQ